MRLREEGKKAADLVTNLYSANKADWKSEKLSILKAAWKYLTKKDLRDIAANGLNPKKIEVVAAIEEHFGINDEVNP